MREDEVRMEKVKKKGGGNKGTIREWRHEREGKKERKRERKEERNE